MRFPMIGIPRKYVNVIYPHSQQYGKMEYGKSLDFQFIYKHILSMSYLAK